MAVKLLKGSDGFFPDFQVKFGLVDSLFAHHPTCAVAGREPKFICWDRINKHNPTFYVEHRMSEPEQYSDYNYGWIIESNGIRNHNIYKKFISKFNKVFTPNSAFLNEFPNCLYAPGGGVWVGGKLGMGSVEINHNKTKLCSMVSSNKTMNELHVKRLMLAKYLQTHLTYKVDVFGIQTWVPIFTTLKDYMFSITIENEIDEVYFTEKILNCFATGVIPIYLGATRICDFFNIDGIIQVDNIEEILLAVNSITEDYYNSRMGAVIDNFNRVRNYLTIEDYIYKNYLSKEFPTPNNQELPECLWLNCHLR